ncbi:large ribosomal subunit protein bL34m [Neodiprion pinetum]|uniref:Large ribosomal subunit protein bL34m n=1 Tax=Neodiprion lecontei TaxID=441921 RepID=A0A6J0BUM7_NEOLC|nr:39S ribosomal protein L34, mitochondrial [Neodiprion lecontei]XP_046489647.1 39S ribosomal protein L34, mitochondrial [Neodiprion pinetum]XP_046626599.1 39S ribosomal protein L34, mitochondrial [Neodiprion virginianus]
MFGTLVSTLFNATRQIAPSFIGKQLHSTSLKGITNGLCVSSVNATAGGTWALIPVRNKIRWHFPKARETIRIVRHGWNTRMSTPNGRRILMRRILKGRHVLSH